MSSSPSLPFEASESATAPLKAFAMLAIRIGESIFGFAPVSDVGDAAAPELLVLAALDHHREAGRRPGCVDDPVERGVEPAAGRVGPRGGGERRERERREKRSGAKNGVRIGKELPSGRESLRGARL